MSTPPRGCIDLNHKGRNSKSPATTAMSPRTPPVNREAGPHAMSVLVTRIDLYDSGFCDTRGYAFFARLSAASSGSGVFVRSRGAALRTFHCRLPCTSGQSPSPTPYWMELNVMDNSTPSPNPTITKYWNQRRRLFSKFDQGIELDAEGWFSVTPEQIADHVAQETKQHYAPKILLDAFCGCGGNAVAFAKAGIQVIAVDVDRQKLRRAAHNARLYGISSEQILFVECNVLFVLEYCYQNGQFILDQPMDSPEKAIALMEAMPPPVATEIWEGFQIGGIDLLPREINTIFMDPPWGGVDYEVFGKHGYDLEHNMKIERPRRANVTTVQDDFFDSFATTSSNMNSSRNKQERKAQFNCTVDDSNCVNGVELLRLAALAAPSVLYDVPRNTRRPSVGQAALAAGYRGNCLWEEHYLNARLKTVTVYFGKDWSFLASPSRKGGGEMENGNME